jgi:excinuclease UvrABC ATPase subunit
VWCGLCPGDNIIVTVEHDETVIAGADRVIELGPGAGEKGGMVVFDGTPAALARSADTATASRAPPPAESTAPKRRAPRAKAAPPLIGRPRHNLLERRRRHPHRAPHLRHRAERLGQEFPRP